MVSGPGKRLHWLARRLRVLVHKNDVIPRPGPVGTCLVRVIAVGCLPQPHSEL